MKTEGAASASTGLELPDIEAVADMVHANWMEAKRAAGVTSRKLENGEELMVPYAQLSEKAKDLDRGTVKTVYVAIHTLRAGGGGDDE